jgi:membrane protein
VLVALLSASAGMRALVTGVNAAYSEAETRGFVRLRGLAFVLTVGGSLVTVVALAVIVALPVAARRLPGPVGLLVSVLRWPLLAAVLIVGLAVLYRVAPSRKDARWQWLSWGSVAATGLWLVGSMPCSLYASYAPGQNKTYGAFFGVIVLLFWLFLSAFAVLLGAELNAELELQTRRDTTVGPPQPLGRRGAYVADHVAEHRTTRRDQGPPPRRPVPNGPAHGVEAVRSCVAGTGRAGGRHPVPPSVGHQRTKRKKERTSFTNSSGCSNAAKWPPLLGSPQ